MARKCFMCGREVAEGILCEKCDKPRRKSAAPAAPKTETKPEDAEARETEPQEPEPPSRPAPPAEPPAHSAPAASPPTVGRRNNAAAAPAVELDPFPKAPVVPFPRDSASPAVTSVVNLLVASGVASVLIGPDRSVKFVSDDAKRLLDSVNADLSTLAAIEARAGIRVGDLSVPSSAGVRIGVRNFIYTIVPLSGGASGAVLVFRPADLTNQAHASFVTYVRETVLDPLRALRDSLQAAAERRNDHFLTDSAAAVEHVLSSLELAPEVEERWNEVRPVPTVTEVVRRVAERFRAYADLKGVRVDVDVQELEERFTDHEQLAGALSILMENALQYVPSAGQVVIGVRWMEHKGKPLILFFVMDNGPVVPEALRQDIFEPSFVWNPSSPERTGRGLFRCREFAVAHAGSVWVESKTGKACTFFMRVRPDGVR